MSTILTLPRDCWRLARPYFGSEERASAWTKLVAVIAMNLALVGLDVVLSFWNRAFFNALQEKDYDSFIGLLLTWHRSEKTGLLPGFVGIAFVYILIAVYRTYIRQWLEIGWRQWMTKHLLEDWLSDRAYYRISLTARTGQDLSTDNPDQRIAEDLRDYVATTLALALDLLSNVVTLFSFVTILWTLSGPVELLGISIPGYMVWVALLYSALGTLFTHLVGRPLVALNFRRQRVEADFRFSLARLRENLEGVALYHGEAQEGAGLRARFHAIRDNWWAIMQRTKKLNALTDGYNQASVIFPFVVAAPRYFAGSLDLGSLTQTAGAFSSVQGAMSWFVNSYSSLATLRATVDRLTSFRQAIVEARAADRGGIVETPAADAHYSLTDMNLQLPNGKSLLQSDAVMLQKGRSIVFTGRSGSGKSTLFRAFAGIWPFGTGRLARGTGTSLFLPQRPYFPIGTLRAALAYPSPPEAFTDAEFTTALSDVALSDLATQLDSQDPWAQRLSGGEQQRLAVARALLIKPDWLFLDEATASLDPNSERQLLQTLSDRLPDTTIVSIAHRPAVAELHARAVSIVRDGDGAGRLEEANAHVN